MKDTKPLPAAMRAADRIMAEGLVDGPCDGGGYSPAHETEIALGIAGIIESEFSGVIEALLSVDGLIVAHSPRMSGEISYRFRTTRQDEVAKLVRDALARVSRY